MLMAQGIPEAPESRERKMLQPVALPRSSGHPMHQGLAEKQCPVAGDPGNPLLQFTFPVPFPSPMEAEITLQFLTPNTELQWPVQKEFNANSSILAVQLTAEEFPNSEFPSPPKSLINTVKTQKYQDISEVRRVTLKWDTKRRSGNKDKEQASLATRGLLRAPRHALTCPGRDRGRGRGLGQVVPRSLAPRLPRGAVRRRAVLKAAFLRRGPGRGRNLREAAARRQRRPPGWPRCPWWAGRRAGSGPHWALAGGSRATAHTLGTAAAAAAAISQLSSRCRLALRMRLRGPRTPSLHTPQPPPTRALSPPVRLLVHEPAAGSPGNRQQRQRMCPRRLSRPACATRSPARVGRRVPPNQDGGARPTRRGRGGIVPCPGVSGASCPGELVSERSPLDNLSAPSWQASWGQASEKDHLSVASKDV
ncbi:hypothetical protein HPG69_012793 [Diceros bicornis minor]|uniref:Uncharacterized protein n=1 Tax=Diceros bicornis minor TaxID=77932 RepID=A0A7J7F0V2_DICBM|nr:hypothetical protein HPG69_012793 [Diceros bicornis minor]